MELVKDFSVDEVNKVESRTEFLSFENREKALLYEKKYTINYKNLNGVWKFLLLDAPEYSIDEFFEEGFNTETWNDIEVPGNWELQGYGKIEKTSIENPTGIYKRKFILSEDFIQNRVIIRFNGVDSVFKLWINGKEVGHSKCSRIKTEFDISNYVRSGNNECIVRASRWSDDIDIKNNDMWHLSGIFRDVELYSEPKLGIKDIKITTDLDDKYKEAVLDVKIKFNEYSNQSVKFELIDDKGSTIFEREVSTKGDLSFKKKVKKPKKWNAEEPNLYTLIISVLADGEIIQVIPHKIGFRKIDFESDTLRVNGVGIKLNEVDRYDFNPKNGRSITKEEVREDIILMKKHNIKVIRTNGYYNSSYLYDLCNEYGMYIIDDIYSDYEASHLSDDYTGTSKYMDNERKDINRVESIIKNKKNHPCIIMWSLGNISLPLDDFIEIENKCMEIDSTRGVNYSNCEKYIYELNGLNYSLDGLRIKDIRATQSLLENKKIKEPITTKLIDLDKGIINITNRYDFLNLETLDLVINIVEDSKIISSKKINLPSVKAKENLNLKLPININFRKVRGASYYLNLSYRLKEDNNFAKEGYELATAQFEIPNEVPKLKVTPRESIDVISENSSLRIIGNDFVVIFDLIKGYIVKAYKDNYKIIEEGPRLKYHNETNDINIMQETIKSVEYDVYDNYIHIKVSAANSSCNTSCHYTSLYEYKIYGSGDILIRVKATPKGKINKETKLLPHIGLKMKINKDFENIIYKGRGPEQSYRDIKEANLFGVYESTIEKLIYNQTECKVTSNRSECSFVSLRNNRGMSMMAISKDKFDFSVSCYEDEILGNIPYKDLVSSNYIRFNIYNNKNNNIYKSEVFDFSFRICLFNNNLVSEISLGREEIE